MTPLWFDKSIDWHWYLNLIQCEFATVKGVFFLLVSSKWNDVSLPPTQSDEISKISQQPRRLWNRGMLIVDAPQKQNLKYDHEPILSLFYSIVLMIHFMYA